MLMAACCREDAHTEKQSRMPHIYIVGGGKRETAACAWVIPGRKDRCEKQESDLVNAFYPVDAGNFSDVGENGFELAAIDNFEARFNTGVLLVGAALEISNIGACAA